MLRVHLQTSFHSTDSSFDLTFAVRIRVKITGCSPESISVHRGIAPRILNLGIGWKWAVSFTLWPPHPEEREQFSFNRMLDVPQSQRSLLTLYSERDWFQSWICFTSSYYVSLSEGFGFHCLLRSGILTEVCHSFSHSIRENVLFDDIVGYWEYAASMSNGLLGRLMNDSCMDWWMTQLGGMILTWGNRSILKKTYPSVSVSPHKSHMKWLVTNPGLRSERGCSLMVESVDAV